MSDIEIKKGRTKKNGEPDLRSKSSAANVSKARSKVKAFLQAGKQIIDNSDSEESGDEIIDLVIRKKDAKIEDSDFEMLVIDTDGNELNLEDNLKTNNEYNENNNYNEYIDYNE